MFPFQKIMKNEKMNLWTLFVYLILFINISQGNGVPMEFLEAFIAAHDRHSTVFIAEKNSGKEIIYPLVLLIFCRIIQPANVYSAFEK